MAPRGKAQQTVEAERERLDRLLLQLQEARTVLTCAIMQLRGQRAVRPHAVLEILVALLKLQRTNSRAAAALGALRD